MTADNFYKKISKNIKFQTYANICRRLRHPRTKFSTGLGPLGVPQWGFLDVHATHGEHRGHIYQIDFS